MPWPRGRPLVKPGLEPGAHGCAGHRRRELGLQLRLRGLFLSSSWAVTLSLSFRGTQPPDSFKLWGGHFSRRLIPSVELGLPWVFLTFPFYLASIEVEEVPEAHAPKNKG